MNKFIQVSARETNSLYRFICKSSRERLSCVSMDKSIQVFTRLILCIDLYVSVCVRDYPASQ